MRERGKIPYDEKPDYEYMGLPAWIIPNEEGLDLVMLKKKGDKEIVIASTLKDTSNIQVNLEALYTAILRKEKEVL